MCRMKPAKNETETDVYKVMKEISTETIKLGGVAKIWLGPSIFYFITNPDDAVLAANACLRKHYIYKFASSFVGEGLVTSDPSKWQRHRKLLSPSFNPSVLDEFIPTFNRQSARLVDLFKDKVGCADFDHIPTVADVVLETICQTAMGLDKTQVRLADEDYRTAFDKLFNSFALRATNIWFHLDFIYYFSRTRKNEVEATKVLLKKSVDVLQKRRATKEAGLTEYCKGRKFKAFLDLMLDLEEDDRLTDREIREHTDTMISAGSDTTAKTMALTLIYIGSHPEVQEKVYQEIMDVLGDSERDIIRDDLPKMVYTEAAIKETLRVCPPLPFVLRDVNRDVKTSNCTIPAGTGIVLSLWGIHHSPCWGADAAQFRLERWFQPLPPPHAFVAFSLGRRNCIGKTHAIMALKIMVVHVLRRYHVQADHTKLRLNLDLTVRPIAGHRIKLELRKKN